jgi:hypothetical protein
VRCARTNADVTLGGGEPRTSSLPSAALARRPRDARRGSGRSPRVARARARRGLRSRRRGRRRSPAPEGCQNSDSRFVEVWQRRDLVADSGRLASAVPVRSRPGSSLCLIGSRARGYQKPPEGARTVSREGVPGPGSIGRCSSPSPCGVQKLGHVVQGPDLQAEPRSRTPRPAVSPALREVVVRLAREPDHELAGKGCLSGCGVCSLSGAGRVDAPHRRALMSALPPGRSPRLVSELRDELPPLVRDGQMPVRPPRAPERQLADRLLVSRAVYAYEPGGTWMNAPQAPDDLSLRCWRRGAPAG